MSTEGRDTYGYDAFTLLMHFASAIPPPRSAPTPRCRGPRRGFYFLRYLTMIEDTFPPLLVFENKYALGWSGDLGPDGPRRGDKRPAEGEEWKYTLDSDGLPICPIADQTAAIDAFTRVYPTDAHCAMYYLPDDDAAPRILKCAVRDDKIAPVLGWIIVDVDTPEHVDLIEAPIAWFERILAAETSIPELDHALRWASKGGYKYAWPLAPECRHPVEQGEHYIAQFVQYLIAGGLPVDENATDWTRLMRLPRVVREGDPESQNYDIDGLDTLEPLAWEAPEPLRADYHRPKSSAKRVKSSKNVHDAILLRLREALQYVDADCDYGRWFAIGTALKTSFSEKGWPVWRDWSLTADGADDVYALKNKWTALPTEAQDGGITIRSILHYAREGGWSDRMSVEDAIAQMEQVYSIEEYFASATLDAAAALLDDNGAPWASVVERAKGPGGPPRFRDWEQAVRSRRKELRAAEKSAKAQIKATKVEQQKAQGGLITNFERDWIDGEEVRWRRPVSPILDDVREVTGGWPRLVDNVLFAPSDVEDRLAFDHFMTINDFWGWLDRRPGVTVEWTDRELNVDNGGKVAAVNKSMTFASMPPTTPVEHRYKTVESVPHEPPLEDAYYLRRDLPAPTGEALVDFLDLFAPDTYADRCLIEAMILTGMWGGPPGKRPAFVITSDHGRASGKTSTAQAIVDIYGGAIRTNAEEASDRFMQRLLDPATLTQRFCMIDNLKDPLSSGPFEDMITAKALNGKRMYVGDGRRVNYLTWIFTANTPALSNDLATRSVVVKIGQADHAVDFDSVVSEFIEDRGEALLADIQARLKEPATSAIRPANYDRWQAWQRAVLTRFPEADGLSELIAKRRIDVDDDQDMSALWADEIRAQLKEAGHAPEHTRTVIPSNILLEIARKVHDDPTVNYRSMWDQLRPIIGVGDLKLSKRYKREPRGLTWVGRRVDPGQNRVPYGEPGPPPKIEHIEDRKAAGDQSEDLFGENF